MDGKARLRRYLEQRRELGESEFVLDGMSVDEALRTLGAIRKGASLSPSSPAAASSPSPSAPAATSRGDAGRREEPQIVHHEVPRVSPTNSSARAQEPDENTMQGRVSANSVDGNARANANAKANVNANANAKTNANAGATGNAKPKATNVVSLSDTALRELSSIDAIAKAVEACTRCGLYETATHAVPGEGNINADLVCVGEAPGANEDASGRPFVGPAGQLLTKILAAVDIKRDDVFICNVIKHRPPSNRNPLPDEIGACSPYLVRQIEIIRPKVILAFGTFAAQTLLATKTPIGKLRGQVHEYHGVPLVVTYHPAALLRNPAWKRPTWEDVKLARRVLDNAK